MKKKKKEKKSKPEVVGSYILTTNYWDENKDRHRYEVINEFKDFKSAQEQMKVLVEKTKRDYLGQFSSDDILINEYHEEGVQQDWQITANLVWAANEVKVRYTQFIIERR